jgi:hypothetical protein
LKTEKEKREWEPTLFAWTVIQLPLYYPMHFAFYLEIGSFTYCLLIYYLVVCKHWNSTQKG